MLGAATLAILSATAFGGCLPEPPMTVTPVVTGLDHPWDVGFAGNTMVYTERAGRISAFVGGQKRLLADPPDVFTLGESGMLGLAVDVAFASNRYIYTCYASTLGNGGNGDVRLVRWTVNADFTALTNRTDIVTGMPLNTVSGRHAGCRPRMDAQGRLWVGTGDAAMGTVPQSPTSLGGKVLRVNRDGSPVAGNPGGALDPRIWSYGHRNVQGVAIRPDDGLGVTVEHGSNRDDELNLMVTGNFGWNPVGSAYNEAVPMTDLAQFPNAVGAFWSSGTPTTAPSGATFLQGAKWRSWERGLAVAHLKRRLLLVYRLNALGGIEDVGIGIDDRGRLRSAVLGPDQDLYIATDNGGGNDVILRLSPSD
jgi:glucose/arabinose dehydrogenase